MNPTRRAQVIQLLQRQAQLERDQMTDEHAQLMEKHNQALEGLQLLDQAQSAAHGHLRQFTSRGAEINPDLYRSVALAVVDRTSKITAAAGDVSTAERDVDVMRIKLRQHEEKIKKLDEIENREKCIQDKQQAVAEFNINDALWLSRRGAQKQ